jgi:hypothetical protein
MFVDGLYFLIMVMFLEDASCWWALFGTSSDLI